MLTEKFLDTLKEDLKLKDSQLKKVEAAISDSREPLKKKSEELRDAMKTMRELRKALKEMEFDLREKIRATLTNEQKERYDELVLNIRERVRPMKPPLRSKDELQDRPSFPPERWEENPDRGRRQREEQPEPQKKP
jgi:chromosome segregation ATPase